MRVPAPREGLLLRDRDALRTAAPLRDRRALRSPVAGSPQWADPFVDTVERPAVDHLEVIIGPDSARPARDSVRRSRRSQVFRHAARGTARARRWLVAAVLLGLVVGGAGVYRARQVSNDLDGARASHADVTTRLVRYEWPAAGTALAAFGDDAQRAADRTSGPLWSLAERLPGVGDDAAAQQRVATDLAAVTRAARPVAEALPQLTALATRTATGEPVPSTSQVDTAALSAVVAALPGLTAALDAASRDLAALPTSGLLVPVAATVADARASLDLTRAALRSTSPTLSVLPALFGASGPRTWVVLLERGTGDRVGAYGVVRAERGALQVQSVHPRGASWRAVHRAVPAPDYVLTLDPQAFAVLTQAMGPVTGGPADQLRIALTRLASGALDWPELFRTLPAPIAQQQLTLHAADPAEQVRLVRAGVADSVGTGESARVAGYLTR